MKKSLLSLSATLMVIALPLAALAQSPKAATYITDEQVKAVNSTPGVDRQIVSVDIGKLNEAVGVIHRGPTNAAPAGRGAAPGGAAPIPPDQACGEQAGAVPAGASLGGI